MNKEKDFFKTCFNTVAGLEVKNESQAIAKEVVLSEIENLQQENKILRENAENNDKVFDKVNWENMLLKKKYLNAVADYETTMSELQELKKQVEEYQEELEKADSITQSCIFNGKKESEISYRKCLNMLEKHKNQQKEFINYLENEIKSSLALDTINKQTAMHIYSTTLRKYKSIIGDDK